VRLTVQKMW